jgi:hypothetical protein
MSTHQEIMDDLYGEIETRSRIVGQPFKRPADESGPETPATGPIRDAPPVGDKAMSKAQGEAYLERARKAKWTARLIYSSYVQLVKIGHQEEADKWLRSQLVQKELSDGQSAVDIAEHIDREFRKHGIILERVQSISSNACLPGSFGRGKRS